MVSRNFLYGTSIFYGEGKGELPLFMSFKQTFKDDHETYTLLYIIIENRLI